MLHPTVFCLGLKRKNSPYVHKFLEGCPLPATLVDDLAGANLKSSTPFFSTMPRYIVAKENRLSTLFFHHALYPAGGARRPYRVVVVRGGRGVRNPPGVPLTSSKSAPEEASCHVYKDPARRSFFYPRPAAVTGSPFSHAVGNKDGERRDMRATPWRSSEDTLLAPLCGVIEGHFVELLKQQAMEEGDGKELTADRTRATRGVKRTTKEELTALLSGGHGGITAAEEEGDATASCLSRRDPVGEMLRSVASLPSSFFYVHAHLPPSAMFLAPSGTKMGSTTPNAGLPVDKSEENRTRTSVLVRLAGGLEPAVPFAVGSPLVVRRGSTCGAPAGHEDTGAGGMPFGHIQCLLRVCTRGGSNGGEDPAEVATRPKAHGGFAFMRPRPDASSLATHDFESNKREDGSACHGIPNGIVEPWKLGVSLDPKLPFYVRTMTERRPVVVHTGGTTGDGMPSSTARGCALLGRGDCETYILPQRELLFSFYAPAEVVAMCAEQNEERMRRQAALGHGGPTQVFVEGPRTARRLLQGAHCNHLAAEEAAAAAASKGGSDDRGTPEGGHVVYEVRAMPGDVLFVPRGWRYSVERIIGTAVMNAAATSPKQGTMTRAQAGSEGLPYGDVRAAFMHNPPSPVSSSLGAVSRACDKTEARQSSMEAAEICGVEVEAFLLCYKPYPVLSAEQAAAYVPANYVRGGVEEFYAKGGNNVFHKYV